MTTIKSYTNLEQSKKLAEILPLESADMYWWSSGTTYYIEAMDDGDFNEEEGHIRAWSLAALLDVLPEGTNVSTPNPINELSYCCWNHYDEIYASNAVDACYEMIIKLSELKML